MDIRDRLWVMLALAGLLAGCGPKPAVEGPGVKVSRAALDAAVAERVRAVGPSNAVAVSADVVRREVVRELVVGERLRAKARELGIADLDAAVEAAWGRYKERFGGEEFFQRYLAKQGRTERQLRREVADKVARQRVLEASAPPEKMEPTDGEIEAYYQGKMKDWPTPGEVRAEQVFVRFDGDADPSAEKKRELIDKARERLVAGEALDAVGGWLRGEMPAPKGEDPKMAPVVATTVTFIEGRSEQEIQRRVFQLEQGQVSEVLRGPLGLHVFKVVERQEPKRPTLDDAREEIRKRLRTQRFYDIKRALDAELGSTEGLTVR